MNALFCKRSPQFLYVLSCLGAFMCLIADHQPLDKMAGGKRGGNIGDVLRANSNYKTLKNNDNAFLNLRCELMEEFHLNHLI